MSLNFVDTFMGGLLVASLFLAFFIFQLGRSPASGARGTTGFKVLFPDRTALFGTLIFIGLFLYLTFWFSENDVWNTNEPWDAILGVPHTFLRLIFVLYLCWAACWIGGLLMWLFERKSTPIVSGWVERIILSFFIGAAILRIVLLAIGYANLYYRLSAVLIFLPILLISFQSLRELVKEGLGKAANVFGNADLVGKLLHVALVGLVIFCLLVLFVKWGLYDGDGDYITHYGPYYDDVIRNHGIYPNSWWYQYYYSHGAGLTFLGMLLTDKMAVGLVSFAFTGLSSLIMFSLVRRISGQISWALLAAICYLAAMVAGSTSFPTKHHEVIAPIITCIVWLTVWVGDGAIKLKWGGIVAGALIMVSLNILSAEASVYALGFLGIYFLWFLYSGRRQEALTLGIWIAAGVVIVALTLSLNHYLSGMHAMTPLRLWVPRFVGWETLKDWISPYILYYLSEASGPDTGRYLIPEIPNMDPKYYTLVLKLLVRAERLGAVFPNLYYALAALGLVLISLFRRTQWRAHLTFAIWPTAAILFLVLASLVAVNQAQSVIRAAGFSGFFLVLAGVTAWHFGVHRWGKAVSGVFVLILAVTTVVYPRPQLLILEHRLEFVTGQKSMWESVKADGWIAAELISEMRREIGMETPVSFMNINSTIGPGYLIGSGLLNPISYSYGKKWHLISFEDAITAKTTFKELGINNFLIDFSTLVYECAAFNPLFSPATLDQFFQVRWHKDSFFLLTWKGAPGPSQPVSEAIVERWHQELDKPTQPIKGVCARMKHLYDSNNGAVVGIKIPDDMPVAAPMDTLLLYNEKKQP